MHSIKITAIYELELWNLSSEDHKNTLFTGYRYDYIGTNKKEIIKSEYLMLSKPIKAVEIAEYDRFRGINEEIDDLLPDYPNLPHPLMIRNDISKGVYHISVDESYEYIESGIPSYVKLKTAKITRKGERTQYLYQYTENDISIYSRNTNKEDPEYTLEYRAIFDSYGYSKTLFIRTQELDYLGVLLQFKGEYIHGLQLNYVDSHENKINDYSAQVTVNHNCLTGRYHFVGIIGRFKNGIKFTGFRDLLEYDPFDDHKRDYKVLISLSEGEIRKVNDDSYDPLPQTMNLTAFPDDMRGINNELLIPEGTKGKLNINEIKRSKVKPFFIANGKLEGPSPTGGIIGVSDNQLAKATDRKLVIYSDGEKMKDRNQYISKINKMKETIIEGLNLIFKDIKIVGVYDIIRSYIVIFPWFQEYLNDLLNAWRVRINWKDKEYIRELLRTIAL